MTTVGAACAAMNELYPEANAEPGDNVGLLIGRRDAAASKILVALDVTDAVIDEAERLGAALIITHHPYLFAPIRAVTDDAPKTARILRLLASGIAVYAAHTNVDTAEDGTSATLLRLLGAAQSGVFYPSEGAGHFGRVGDLPSPMPLEDFAAQAAKTLGLDTVRYYGGGGKLIQKVGAVAGSGMQLAACAEAARLGCGVFVTGDVKYHAAQDALDMGLCVIDVTHEAGERPALPILRDKLAERLAGAAEVTLSNEPMFTKTTASR